ncbi:6,7-dimethyl-8-ribityllumazine synthase [Bathymodiolus heckerae thiotrophic gill symbiont]|uniref:6,7-dimethyl-8-ribityllumazine synthase n=1 Tax=Bathymodiolus heckerae thiotrophic gill symbiont TaxID=1052212 RepID=UPI0010B99B20|nr:6,7-dimethyl-8-ribityllumazine synthase [Bathymodiolus heckerae thiotrophic gill symbiont]SMN13793.1 6,7-dimethyl-8-ribityllumazine synthase [Bathymodiolus heckerae thiotrophic gill symbiont]
MNFKFNKNTNTGFLKDKKVALIVGYFYQDIGDKLLTGAQGTLEKYGINEKDVDVFYVPGAFEIPLMAKKLAKSKSYDGIVTLGAVINGETPHFDFVCSECARGVADVSYQYETPTAFGVLTTSNMEQTIGRAGGYKGNKGVEATMAMIEMLYLLDQAK